jgi:putative hydrolase of the HAD superfamily
MPVKAVLLDFDDTLCPETEAERGALIATCSLVTRKHGVDAAALADRLGEHAGRLWGSWGQAAHYRAIGYSRWEGLWGPFDLSDSGLTHFEEWMPDYRRRSWSNALEDFGVRDDRLVAELIEAYRRERRARQAPYPDALHALRQIAPLYRVALVTNGSPAVQRSKLAVSGLERHFTAVIVSGEVGAGKPDPRPFMAALNATGARPGEAVMVGNSLERDVAGAQRLGMKAVWINRNGDSEAGAKPDATLTSLRALPALIARLGRAP